MAGIITHALLSIDALNELNINYDLAALKVFSCGPDLFYSSKKEYGKKMHRKKTQQFFLNYINYIKNNHLESDLTIISSLYGFISHYILDKNIHPYIFYKTGVFEKNNPDTRKYLDLHTIMEKYIDFVMLKDKNINYQKWHAWKFLFSKYKPNNKIKELLNDILNQTYNFKNGGNYYIKAIKQYRRNYHYIRYDPFNIKYRIYSIIDLFRKNKSKIKYLSHHYVKIMDLNLERKSWYHPVTYKEFHESVFDLIDKSKKEYKIVIKELNKVLYEKKDITNFLDLIKNYSYINGLDCGKYHKMVYFEN